MTGDLDAMFAEWRDIIASEPYEHQDTDAAVTAAMWVPPTQGQGGGCVMPLVLGAAFVVALVVVVVVAQFVLAVA